MDTLKEYQAMNSRVVILLVLALVLSSGGRWLWIHKHKTAQPLYAMATEPPGGAIDMTKMHGEMVMTPASREMRLPSGTVQPIAPNQRTDAARLQERFKETDK